MIHLPTYVHDEDEALSLKHEFLQLCRAQAGWAMEKCGFAKFGRFKLNNAYYLGLVWPAVLHKRSWLIWRVLPVINQNKHDQTDTDGLHRKLQSRICWIHTSQLHVWWYKHFFSVFVVSQRKILWPHVLLGFGVMLIFTFISNKTHWQHHLPWQHETTGCCLSFNNLTAVLVNRFQTKKPPNNSLTVIQNRDRDPLFDEKVVLPI